MRGWPRGGGATGGGRRSHHIDEVAHLFLSGPRMSAAVDGAPAVIDVAVAAPGPGRAAACAAAGLAVAAQAAALGSCLIEDADVPWSAFSFLTAVAPPPPPDVAAGLPRGLRAGLIGPAGPATPAWLRWRLLGEASPANLAAWEVPCGLPACARAAPPTWAALAWCAAPHDAVLPQAQEALRRLIALLAPGRLEFLVLPDAWDTRPGGWRLVGRRRDPGWRNLSHLQEVARAAAGGIPVAVRVLPDAAAEQAAAVLALVVDAVAGSATARAIG